MKSSEEERGYEALSPFELKNKLITMAQTHHERMMLNAGRGNPNWITMTPQQVLMVLFSLYCLIDKKGEYKKEAQSIVTHRFKRLYAALGTPHPENRYGTRYYTTIDILAPARTRYGEEFAAHLAKNYQPIDFVWRLADEKSIILTDGGGFDAPSMSVRVSLANLPNSAYEAIGKGISDLLFLALLGTSDRYSIGERVWL